MSRTAVGHPMTNFFMRRCKRSQWDRLGRLYEQAGGRGIVSEVKFNAEGITLWSPNKEGILIPWGSCKTVIDREVRFMRESRECSIPDSLVGSTPHGSVGAQSND